MGGTFSNLNISLSGMLGSQSGLSVTGQNIANANSEGYTRKIINFTENSVPGNGGAILPHAIYSGVEVEEISRARDNFLDSQFRTQNTATNFAQEVANIAVTMNDILGEPSEVGIASKLNSFFEATSDLAANPELITAKTVFINSARSLTNTFNEIDAAISDLRTSMDKEPNGRLALSVRELNSKLEILAATHKEIVAQQALGHEVSSLEDQRDLLLDELSGLINLNIVRDDGGNFLQINATSNATEAKVTSTAQFPNHDAAIAPAITGAGANNTLTLSANNGNGTAVGPFTVTFEDNSTIRDVVTKINQTYVAAGGIGSIASVDKNNRLVLETSLMGSARNSSTAAINVAGGTSLAALGLAGGITTGSDPSSNVLINHEGLNFKFAVEKGSNEVASNPAKVILIENNALKTKVGTLDQVSGSIGGILEATNKEIPEMRAQLDNLMVSIKNGINWVLDLGTTADGNPSIGIFTGNKASDFSVIDAVIDNPALVSPSKTGAASDGAIAEEVSRLFFNDHTIISDGSTSQKVYIDSPSALPEKADIPIIPGQPVSVIIDGIIDDNGSAVNAGTNGFGGGSLVQIEFLDASGALIGAPIDFPASAGPPEDTVSFSGNAPAGAAFVQFRMNSVSFNDNDITNNQGHFGIKVFQGSLSDVAENFTDGFASITGDFGTRASFANSKLDSSTALRASIDANRQSISGVSLEEEAANLIQFQNAFAANARVMSVIDEVIQEILGIV